MKCKVTSFLLILLFAMIANSRLHPGYYNGGIWSRTEVHSYGWPFETGYVEFDIKRSWVTYCESRQVVGPLHWQWRQIQPVSTTINVAPLIANLAWWSAIVFLAFRSVAPHSLKRKGMAIRFSLRGLLTLQSLAAIALAVSFS